jgi:hypothetical protein
MSATPEMDRSRIVVSSLQEQAADECVRGMTPAECLGIVWQLTLDAWTFKEPSVAESRFQRHVVRVVGRRH